LPDSAPAALREIVSRATDPAPDRLYQSAREMKLALDRYLVVARSEADRQPPTLALANWLRQMFESRPVPPSMPEVPDSDAPVRTFLDDGVDGVVSLAGTRAETAADTAPQTVMETAVSQSVDPPRRRLALWALAAVGGIAVLGGAAIALSGGHEERDTGSEPSVATISASTDGEPAPAGPSIDAGRPPDAAPPRPVVDGGRIGIDGAPPPARPRRRAPPREAPAVVGEPGVVKVHCQPWAKVSVAGRGESCAETPCTLSLPPGTHTLRLSNPVSRFAKSVQVEVVSGETR
jgi:hypothetical protein